MIGFSDVFSCFPKKYYLDSLDRPNSKKAEYILERISDLNFFIMLGLTMVFLHRYYQFYSPAISLVLTH